MVACFVFVNGVNDTADSLSHIVHIVCPAVSQELAVGAAGWVIGVQPVGAPGLGIGGGQVAFTAPVAGQWGFSKTDEINARVCVV